MTMRFNPGAYAGSIRAVSFYAARTMTFKKTLLRHVTAVACFALSAGAVSLLAPVSVGYAQSAVDRGVSVTAQGVMGVSGQYVVVKGDSLYGISRRFGLDVNQVKTLNGLANNGISVGQRLTVSTSGAGLGAGAGAGGSTTILAPQTPVFTQALTSRTYTVQRGDTAYRVARTNGISLADLVAFNNLDGSYSLSVGQVLIVGQQAAPAPALDAVQVTTVSPVTSIAPLAPAPLSNDVFAAPIELGAATSPPGSEFNFIPAPRPVRTLEPVDQAPVPSAAAVDDWTQNVPLTNATSGSTNNPTTIELARRKLDEAKVDIRQNEQLFLPSSPAAGSGDRQFTWPVRGRLLSSFGPREGGLVNDGINIAVRTGEAVKSAAAGKVLYASDEMDAFGNLVLVEHADGWVTAYAHNDQLAVAKGDVVQQGQTIARAGSSGTVSRSQLHFEIRQNGKPVNPMTVLAY